MAGIYGLSGSGMDIDELVTGMMKTQQAKYDKLYKQKTVQAWKKEQYNTMYKSLYNFRYNTLSDFKLQSSMSAKKAISSNESVVTAKALGDAAQMSHDIAIKKLSSNVYLQTADKIHRENSSAEKSIKLSDIAGVSEADLKNGGDKIAMAFSIDDGVNGKKTISYTYNDLAGGKTLNDLVSDVDSLGTNIKAIYDNNNDSFSLYNKLGGETNKLIISLENSVTTTDSKGVVHTTSVDNAAVQRTATFVKNLQLKSYDSATKEMTGDPIELDSQTKYSVGVSGKSGAIDFTSASSTLSSMLGINIEAVDGEPDKVKIGDKVFNKTDEALKLKINGKEVSFTYEDLTAQLDEPNNTVMKKFADAGTTVKVTMSGQTGTFNLTRADGQAISFESVGDATDADNLSGTYSAALAGKLNGLSGDKLTSSITVSDATTIADIAGITKPADKKDEDTAFSLMINGKELSFSYQDINGNISSFVDKINGSNAGVKAEIVGGKLSIYGAETDGTSNGSEVNLAVKVDDNKENAQKFINALKLQATGDTAPQEIKFDGASQERQGQSAEAIIDGKTYKSDSNTITAGGVVYTANKVSETNTDGSYAYAKVTVNSDNDTIVDKVKNFVTEYNKMLDELNSQIYAEYDSKYLPLTDDEKSAMTDEQVKKWEEKAKTGLLAKDSILKDTVNKMRSAMSSILTGTGNDYNSMAKLGITTTDYTEHGKIELDEDALRKSLEKDPDAVYKLFSNLTDETNERGIVHKISDIANDALSKLNKEAGVTADVDESYVGTKIKRLNTQMTTLQERMDKQQSMLYKKFNAMETAISQLNQQYSYISSAFGSSS